MAHENLKGFHTPKHIQALRERQTALREKGQEKPDPEPEKMKPDIIDEFEELEQEKRLTTED